ncbi:MAG: histidine kinase [Verrucomicrobiales bacterium]|nr:histidine kinase [Verrucomicrobiales bacterium]
MYNPLEQLVSGHHAALLYRTPQEQFESVIPFILIGLLRKERCLYVAGENTVQAILGQLKAAGVDVEREQRRGALNVAPGREVFLKSGMFQPEKMLGELQAETAKALEDGFSGLRATGEMTWTLDVPGALEDLVQYEAALDRLFPKKLTGLCQYNEYSFRGALLGEMIYLHPRVIAKGQVMQNPWYNPARYKL